MSAPAINSTTDAVTYLVGQHRRIRELFDEVAGAADTGERERKFFELRRLLAVHETAEEEIIHPLARRAIDNGDAVVDARLEEENKAKSPYLVRLLSRRQQMRAAARSRNPWWMSVRRS
uniref:hemerythrin domain-containing protein n=1 Tax=Nocardia farcinica TaxID=37329 RepID=UPI0024538F81